MEPVKKESGFTFLHDEEALKAREEANKLFRQEKHTDQEWEDWQAWQDLQDDVK